MNPILAIELERPVEPNHENFLNARSQIGLDFIVNFDLPIPR
jgi:hypothetical protein